MTTSYIEAAQNGSRFNLWVTIEDCSKVICFGTWAELIELVQPVLDGSIRAVHVLPDGEEPDFTYSPSTVFFDDEDEEEDEQPTTVAQ